ncbi:EamA family transporter RarD [Salinicola aestuarinus]|uniref:EamA family transporter RarD n=1 Tax=Salinicola aestuarinus TaxID=1949082 RepID=UPI000DA1F8BC|nr:EamA family transporter RarD [Salinicola aestuarinus]
MTVRSRPLDPPRPPEPSESEAKSARDGVGLGILAYSLWGCFPLFFALFDGVPALEVLVHRILWSCVFLIMIVTLLGRWQAVLAGIRRPGALLPVAGCAVLIAANWGLFIYAVETARVLQASLGYFITPLVNVALGMVAFQERLGRWQAMAILFAVAGIVLQLIWLGRLPWISLCLAASFGTYGLLRKKVVLDGLSGLLVETALLAPVTLGAFLWLTTTGTSHFTQSLSTGALLMASGIITTLPLLAFAGAARRLRLATLGFLMYLNPSLQLFIALVVFGEPLNHAQLATFLLIWIGLVIYSLSTWQTHHRTTHVGRSTQQ